MSEPHPAARYETYANLIAPATAGVALGMLFGRGMERKTCNIVALSLLATAVAVAAPVVTDLVQRAANRPGSARGSRRRLRGIRNGSLPSHEADEFFAFDETPGGAA